MFQLTEQQCWLIYRTLTLSNRQNLFLCISFCNYFIILISILPVLQELIPAATWPGGQVQPTVLRPSYESSTVQTWFLPQGLEVRQGFWQRSSIQAILTGQSRSTRHSGSGSASMGEVQKAYPSPSSGGMHVHVSLWFLARHSAPWAHLFPLQSSLHFWEFTSHCSLS